MRGRGDHERGRRWRDAAEELFDALHPEDFAALLAKYDSRSRLREAVADRAQKVADKVGTTEDPLDPDGTVLLLAACLTWGRNQAGVAANTAHAAKKFHRYRRFAQLPVGTLVRADRIVPDDEQVIGLLAESLRIRAGVGAARSTAERSTAEPELILNMVIPALVAALGPAADAALVRAALDVLDRGAGLAAAYQVSGRAVPGMGTDLPVVGNADFLVRIAAYHLAIEERRGLVVRRPLDGLEQAVTELTSTLRKAMTRPAGLLGRPGSDEPDVATALHRYAGYLGSAAGAGAAGRRASTVFTVLSYRLRIEQPPVETPVDDPAQWRSSSGSSWSSSSPDAAEHAARLSDVEHLVGWLIAALFRGADKAAQEALLEWLDGRQLTDQQKYLPLLVCRLRIATAILDEVPASRPPRPAGITPSRFEAVAARLVAAVDPGEIHGCERADARRVTLAALPSLWTRRRPAIQLVAAHLRVRIGSTHSGARKAVLVATHGVRAPVQFVQPSASPLPVPCCADGGLAGRPAARGRPREPAPYQEICPHRPWGEIGWVESYRTLADAAGYSADAARKQLERYEGPYPELLWK